MNIKVTLKILSGLLIAIGGALLLPIPVALVFNDGQAVMFGVLGVLAIVFGVIGFKVNRSNALIGIREGFGIVAFCWILYAIVGGIPFLVSGVLANPVDAYFEAMSGFTTTGSTVITDLTAVPASVLFWRSITQWLGGMGIIVLSLAILPFLGVGGMQLFQAEVPGPTDDRITPRVQDTAKILWKVYLGLTVVLFFSLLMAGMDVFDSINHALTTMATGGFSVRNESIAYYEESAIHWVLSFFMLVAGTNFALHYFALRGRFQKYIQSEEFRFYCLLLLFSVVSITVALVRVGGDLSVSARDATFQVASIISTTGYASADYELWPGVAVFWLLLFMFTGGMAGSTAGGMKLVRIVLVLKHASLEIFKALHPKGVRSLRLDRVPVAPSVVSSVLGFSTLFLVLVGTTAAILTALGLDFKTASTVAVSAFGNIGPGLGSAGPTETYAALPVAAKIVTTVGMLMGRLELITVLVLFNPDFWRK